MLVARRQLNFVAELVRRFETRGDTLNPVDHYQVLHIAIVTLLRSVGHVFEKVDCDTDDKKRWATAKWKVWKQQAIFKDFIEPRRNRLLKEFGGTLQPVNSAFGSSVFAAGSNSSSGIEQFVPFNIQLLEEEDGQLTIKLIQEAIDFWNQCLGEAEVQFHV